MYLTISHESGYIEQEGVNKYLVFNSTDENKELLKKYNDVFNGIRSKIKNLMVMNVTMKKITWKLNLIQTLSTSIFRWYFIWIKHIKVIECNSIEYERIDVNKKCNICHYWYFKDISLVFVMDVMI